MKRIISYLIFVTTINSVHTINLDTSSYAEIKQHFALRQNNTLDPLLHFQIHSSGSKTIDKKKFKKASISYLFMDMKYSHDRIKICEFGGKAASPAETTINTFEKKFNLITPYWLLFWEYLSQFQLPVWYVGGNLVETSLNRMHSITRREKMYWDTFLSMGGRYAKNLNNLETDTIFQILAKNEPTNFQANKISTYSGIIVFHKFENKIIKNFQKKYPHFLVTDTVTKPYTRDKAKGARLFKNKQLQQYKPKFTIFQNRYNKNLAKEIIGKIRSPLYVIKPVNLNQSKGVFIVDRHQLDKTLKKILKNSTSQKRQDAEYWKAQNKKDLVIVEEFCHSKRIKVRHKWYEPTMRMVCMLHYDDGKIHASILGGYWKIPNVAVSDPGTYNERYKTVPRDDPQFTGLEVDYDDTQNVHQILKKMLPHLYHEMLKECNQKGTFGRTTAEEKSLNIHARKFEHHSVTSPQDNATRQPLGLDFENYTVTSQRYDTTRQPIGLDIILQTLKKLPISLQECKLLDAGCGTGNYLSPLADHVGYIVGIDVNENMLKIAAKKCNNKKNTTLRQGSILDFPYNNESFDAIIINQVIHHLENEDTIKTYEHTRLFIKEAMRVIKNKGYLILNISTHEQLRDGFWFYSLIPEATNKILEKHIPLTKLRKILLEEGFIIDSYITPVDTVLQGEKYFDTLGPFDKTYRDGDSTWSLATKQELNEALNFLEQMNHGETLDEYYRKREYLRKQIGQTVFVIAKKE